ncbi:MAG TPA: glutathione S-transferase N-terminal domain-containing protein [Polyangiaceae bacterium]
MILIGQYDSPFVRRVAIAIRFYGMQYEHRPWSVFADADKIVQFNPLRRVPTLVLDWGEVLVESSAIIDTIGEWIGPNAPSCRGAARSVATGSALSRSRRASPTRR